MILLFRITFVAALLLITWLALTPSPPPAAGMMWDKGNHLIAFLVLAFLAEFSLQPYALASWLGLGCYGVAIEIVQWLLEFRYFELNDIVADCAGILLYILLSPLTNRIEFLRQLRTEG